MGSNHSRSSSRRSDCGHACDHNGGCSKPERSLIRDSDHRYCTKVAGDYDAEPDDEVIFVSGNGGSDEASRISLSTAAHGCPLVTVVADSPAIVENVRLPNRAPVSSPTDEPILTDLQLAAGTAVAFRLVEPGDDCSCECPYWVPVCCPPQTDAPTPGQPRSGGFFRVNAQNRLIITGAYGVFALEEARRPSGRPDGSTVRCWRATMSCDTINFALVATAVATDFNDPLFQPVGRVVQVLGPDLVVLELCLLAPDGTFLDPSVLGAGTGAGVTLQLFRAGPDTFVATPS